MIRHNLGPVSVYIWFFVAGLCCGTVAQQASTKPVAGLRKNVPDTYALTRAEITVSPGRVLDNATIVIRNGVIHDIGADLQVPKDARVIDCEGKSIYPGLIDAYSETDLEHSQWKTANAHWNPLIRPQASVRDGFKVDKELNKKLRSQGITARLVAPAGGIIKGTSAVVSTADLEEEQAVLVAGAALHMRLTVDRGRGRDQYPNSPMGAVALARQTMLDTSWYAEAWRASQNNPLLPRPDRNVSLEALHAFTATSKPIVIDSLDELYFLRAEQFAREFALNLILRGSGDEYRQLAAVRQSGRPVIVPLDFPKPPNVSSVESAINVSLKELMHWDLAPENPARLHKAGVRIALTTHGLKEPTDFLRAVRKAVSHGLEKDAALRALTTTPAELFGVSSQVGSLKRGKVANFAVTDGDLFEEKTKILETWVNGHRHEIESTVVKPITGTWLAAVSEVGKAQKTYELVIESKGEKLSGTLQPVGGKKKQKKLIKLDRLGFRSGLLSGTFDSEGLQRKGVARMSLVLDVGQRKEATLRGKITWPDGTRSIITARKPDSTPQAKEKEEKNDVESGDKEPPKNASFEPNFPLGAFGLEARPDQPSLVLFKHATIWTCGKGGILENAAVLVENGRIRAVGHDIDAPKGAVVVDCEGKHITPGIIDCHSHMATDGGINESTQAITAEVRIGDFVDSNDIAIYRQLAGGVTCVSILHGSANPIGGQNQVIKLRWSALPEEMKFAEAPAGIKFALGENVKQSNWGDQYTTRYPQTRMGVEQIIRDAFRAAKQYQNRWDSWEKTHEGLPPRRDLELEAIGEILDGSRWIHCHSYRQDEILALIRTLDDFGVTIGTFQHILEGYKVADAMAKHGAMGSAFSDWWAYKFEVYDAIPYNGALMHQAGVNVSFNSDDRELARHLNQEAAKAIKYGGVEPVEALKFVTLNPAMQLRIDKWVGSIERGKHADLVVWSGPPLSNFSRCEQTWIDGRKYFDRVEDLKRREKVREMRRVLIQKILASGEEMAKDEEKKPAPSSLWPRHDIFCHGHNHEGH